MLKHSFRYEGVRDQDVCSKGETGPYYKRRLDSVNRGFSFRTSKGRSIHPSLIITHNGPVSLEAGFGRFAAMIRSTGLLNRCVSSVLSSSLESLSPVVDNAGPVRAV
uniref:Uncharacterized protein n=1 Tax=Sipha flava TaxID=143950 RepID=A0A2S2QZF1_9HEMI